MIRRADDNAKTVASRLKGYASLTAPLIEYYSQEGVLHQIDAMGEIEDVTRAIDKMVINFSSSRE
jgi:adenylate kinase